MGNTPKKKNTAANVTPIRNAEQELRDRQGALQVQTQEEYDQRVQEATEALDGLERTMTQREWLLITARLDRTREQIATDGPLRLLALGWLKEKREHGGASWDVLLDMTDDDLVQMHGFPTETPEEARERLEAAADQADQADQADPAE